MKTGWKLLIVAGLVLAVLAGPAMAQPGRGMGRRPGYGRGPGMGPGMGMGMGRLPAGPMGPGGVLGPMAAQLDLTAEQRNAIRDICQKSRADANEVVEAIEEARADLHEAVVDGASAEQVRAAAAKLGTAIGNQAVLRSQTLAAVKAVLTPEQLKQLEKIKANVPHTRRPMGGQGFGGGPWGGPRGPQAHGPGPNAGPAPVPHLGLERIFKAADANEDGVLSLEELRAFQETAPGGRGPGRR